MILSEQQRKAFEEVVEPVMKFIVDNCEPHAIILVGDDYAYLYEGTACILKGCRRD